MADFNLSYTGLQVNNAIEAVTNALGSGGLLSINSFNNTIANYSTTAQIDSKLASRFPVGAVYITSTNSNPGSYLGGTWTLIDKEFEYHNIADFTPTLNTTNCSAATVNGYVIGHTIRIQFSFTTKITLNDDTIELFTIPMANFGIQTDWLGNHQWSFFSDGKQTVIALQMTAAGVVRSLDVLQRNNTAASVDAGSFSATTLYRTVVPSRMLDSWCNKFYWKRTA